MLFFALFCFRGGGRPQAMADVAELEGLDKAIAWVKNIYIFGLFEGETGEEAPWYLKPVSRSTLLLL